MENSSYALMGNLTVNDTLEEHVSNEYSVAMICVSYCLLSVAAFGLPGNILILITYAKIIFSEPINISYSALGVADTIGILFITWNAICFLPQFMESDLPFLPMEIVVVTSGATGECFGAITAWTTAFISFERCLCVVRPLKVRMFITRMRTLVIIILIFVATLSTSLGVYLNVYEFVPRFVEDRNKTVLGMQAVNDSRSDILYTISYIYSTLFSYLLPLALIMVFSIILVVHMKRQASWRLEATYQSTNQNGSSSAHDPRALRKYTQDMRVSKTVLCIAVVSCILGTLYALRSLLAAVVPSFQPMQRYGWEYRLVSRLLMVASGINSSVNIIIYYTMGTMFRTTLNSLLRLKN